jgi:hypothetical protein
MRRWCGLVLVGSGLVMALCCVGEGLAATRTYVDLWRNGLPAAAIIVGEVAGPDLALGGLMIGSALAVLGIVLRASSRRVDGEMPHVAWIGGTGLGGFLSWLSIGWAARRLGRPALVRWSIGYGVAMVAAVGLLAGSLLLGELGPPGLALWAIVWVSSMVHGWMLVPAMAGTSHDGSGGPAQYSPLMTK